MSPPTGKHIDEMKKLHWLDNIICLVTLGLLCGWYHFLFFLVYPTLFFLIFKGWYRYESIAFIGLLYYLGKNPLDYEPQQWFLKNFVFKLWSDYFEITTEVVEPLKKGEKYFMFEFPHGVMPLGQICSGYHIDTLFPGEKINGTGADAIFTVPGMRHFLAAIGTMPAKKENMVKSFEKGNHVAVIPGGIAEMFLINDKTEEVFLKSRRNTVKVAIQNGASIVPIYFFGNTNLFTVVGTGEESYLAKLSRKIRTSLIFFYGRFYLPVPYRHPLKIVSGRPVPVKKSENPTAEEIDDVMNRVVQSLEEVYSRKPDWETRPLVVK